MQLKNEDPYISVIVPVYKAESSLDELYSRLKKSLEEISPDFEIVLVEDCGGDRSWQMIERLAMADPRVRGIQLSRNFGQHYGITAGLDSCRGEWVVVMDCDLQDRPEEIPRLYAKAKEGYDVVLALRGARRDPLLKRIASCFFYKIFSYLADFEYDGNSGNFRIISRKVVDNLCQMREQLRFFGALVHWMGFSTTGIEVEHAERLQVRISVNVTGHFASNVTDLFTSVARGLKCNRIGHDAAVSSSFFRRNDSPFITIR